MRQFFQIEALDRWFQHRMLDVHTALPAKVLAYDATAQTVDVRPQTKRYVLDQDGSRTAEEVPDLYGVPVAFPRAGGFHITLPVTAGDYVIVLFAEEPTQAWRAKARVVAPGILDRHGLNGAFALPCGFPDAAKLTTSPPTDAVEIASDSGTAGVVIKSGEVLVGDATATDSASLDSAVQAELARLQSELTAAQADLTTLKAAVASGLTAVGVGPAANGPAGAAAFNAAAAAVPTLAPASPGATAAAKVRLK